MQVHRIVIAIVDHDRLGVDEICDVLVNTRYPNDCINPQVLSAESADVGEWSDDHPLNHSNTCEAEIDRLFPKEPHHGS